MTWPAEFAWRDWRAVSLSGGSAGWRATPSWESRHAGAWEPAHLETGTRKQQRDCCQAEPAAGEGTPPRKPQAVGNGRGEGADEQDKDQRTASEEQDKKESYLDAMEAAGFKNPYRWTN